MKKVILLAIIAFSFDAHATWVNRIVNKTNSKIKFNLNYNNGWCNDDEVLVGSNDTKIIKNEWCCPSSYKVTGLEKSLKNKTAEATTSMCRHIFTITQDASGNLAVNDEKW